MEAEHHHALNMGVALSAFNPLRTPCDLSARKHPRWAIYAT